VTAAGLARSRIPGAGGEPLGKVYDGESGIDRAQLLRSPDGQVFKLFCGMETGPTLEPGDRPVKFEHVSFKTRNTRRLERFLQEGLGLQFSDRMGPLAAGGTATPTTTASPSSGRRRSSCPTTRTHGPI
jgi:hypothetical protein